MLQIKNVLIITDMIDVGINEVRLRIINGLKNKLINFESVAVENFNITNGAFLLRLLADSCKGGDIFLVVLDPRFEDKPRDSICFKTRNNFFLAGPNNGVFSWVIKDFGIKECVELPLRKENLLFPTFNGKYKFSLAITKLLEGKSVKSLGKKFRKEDVFIEEIENGTIVHIDNYGNLKIKGGRPKFKLGGILEIKINKKVYPAKFGAQYFDVQEGELVVYAGSSLGGLPEIAINRGNAAKFLDVKIGDKITIIEKT